MKVFGLGIQWRITEGGDYVYWDAGYGFCALMDTVILKIKSSRRHILDLMTVIKTS